MIGITDRDTMKGALLAHELAVTGNYSFEVVTGMETSTNAGHMPALLVDRHIPYDEKKSLRDRICEVHELGGLCVVPHPMSNQKTSISRKHLEIILANPDRSVRMSALDSRYKMGMNQTGCLHGQWYQQ